MENLINWDPKDILLHHGPTKRMVNKYHYHSPNVGIVASYVPTERDVEDHFNVFRGVDQIESFAQAATCSCTIYSECVKMNITPLQMSEIFFPFFISIGQVNFHDYIEKGDTFVNIGLIKFYKFRQMVCDGKIYKLPAGFDLDAYFKNYTDQQLLAYDLSSDFKLVAELSAVTGRCLKRTLTEKQFV